MISLLAEEFIYQSLISGKELGYDTYVMPESILGKSPKKKERAIKKLKSRGVKTLDNYAPKQ
ncbi:hypothetical protein HNS38_16450 [Lentimicrobium sp. L6]|uniref:hypothetical protein n=1 Tax=Lentimicrobium sp. L6 TaxID=2735916 RepID=UPI0015540FBB|nr:hypothetical protein [Lentimicrobium sp. L6]NPD86365.1 hypothetical protein [Lentimicrobium sp. L6]